MSYRRLFVPLLVRASIFSLQKPSYIESFSAHSFTKSFQSRTTTSTIRTMSSSTETSTTTSTTSDGGGVIALNVKVCVKPEYKQECINLLTVDAKETRKEPGGLQFVFGQDVHNDNVLILHEQYKSMKDLQYHNTTPHFNALMKYMESNKKPFTDPPTVNIFQCNHEPVAIDNSQRIVYCLNVESCIKPELRDEYIELLEQHQQKSLAEELCVQFDWGISVDDPNTIYIHEEYEGEDHGKGGFLVHESSDHFAKFMKFNEEKRPYTKPQIVQFYKAMQV